MESNEENLKKLTNLKTQKKPEMVMMTKTQKKLKMKKLMVMRNL
jgi:hypothetical protein